MSAKQQTVAAALTDWINACPIEPKISNLGELSDGIVVAKVLLDIDPYYFKTTAASSEGSGGAAPGAHWVLRFQKLKRLHKDLTRYYTENLGHRLPSAAPNLTMIAKDSNVEETIKFVKIIVAAAVQSDRRENYIKYIQDLSPSSQTELMQAINQMMVIDTVENTLMEGLGAEQSKNEEADMDQFRMEEEMARLVAEKEAVEAKNRSLEKRLGSLQSDFDENQSHLLVLQDQLSSGAVDQGYANRTDPMIRSQLDQLQSDVQKLEDVIAEKESTIHGHENVISSLNRRVDDLLPKAEAGVKYKDDLDEANHTIDKLKKSQNVAEKYRRKLEGMGELERQVKTMEQQHSQMLQDLRASQESSKQVPSLKRIVEQYKKQIEKMEMEYAELLRQRNNLDVERNMLKEKVQGAESQKSRDMERIQYLEEKVREIETGVIPQSADHTNGDLNSELNFTSRTKTDLKMQIERLEAELNNLKESGGASADNIMLKQLLDDATLAKNKLEQDFLVAHTDKLVLEAQLTAIRGGTSVEGSDVMLRLRQSLIDAEKQLSEFKLKCSEVEAELSVTKRELVTAQSDLSLVDKDKLEILAELRALVGAELIELRQEYDDMRTKVRELEIDVEQKKSLLNTVLLEKDEISKKVSEQKDLMLEKEKSNSELKATIAAFTGSAEGRDGALEKRVLQLQNKLEDRREKMTKSREHIKKQNGIIKDLKEQLEQAVSSTTDANVKAKEEQLVEFKRKKQEELAFLERENTLMATAWYDQASRLQMNSFVLQRMGDAPSSWLNKQRMAIHSSKKK